MIRLRWFIVSNVLVFLLTAGLFWILPVKADNPQTVATMTKTNPKPLTTGHRPPRISMPLDAQADVVIKLASGQSLSTIIENKCENPPGPPKRFHKDTANIKNFSGLGSATYATALLDCYELELWIEK